MPQSNISLMKLNFRWIHYIFKVLKWKNWHCNGYWFWLRNNTGVLHAVVSCVIYSMLSFGVCFASTDALWFISVKTCIFMNTLAFLNKQTFRALYRSQGYGCLIFIKINKLMTLLKLFIGIIFITFSYRFFLLRDIIYLL